MIQFLTYGMMEKMNISDMSIFVFEDDMLNMQLCYPIEII